jgi:hypothetical protein
MNLLGLPEPKDIAHQLLLKAGLAKPPVELERVSALWPDLKIDVEDLDSEGYILDMGKLGAEIVVRSEDVPSRRRYSIAHELGHWILKLQGISRTSDSTVERWCDKFAACLLMPEEWVVRDLRKVGLSGLAEAVLAFPNYYQVSHRAFRLRVSELTPVSVFELKQNKTGTVVVEKRYEAPCVPKADLAVALRTISILLNDQTVPPTYFHEDCRLLSLHKRCFSKNDARKWLICVLPKAGPSKPVKVFSNGY